MKCDHPAERSPELLRIVASYSKQCQDALRIAILRLATTLNVPYEWQANVPMSRNNGLTDDQIEHIGTPGPVEGLPAELILAC